MIDRLKGLGRNFFIGMTLLILAGATLYFYADQQGLSYRELIVVSSALSIAVIVFGREQGIRLGLVLWVLTLGLGYRTIGITPDLVIHPAEVLLWVLLICTLVQRGMLSGGNLAFPVWLWIFIPFWVLAWWPMIGGAGKWDQMLNEFRNFLLLIPLIILASIVLQRQQYWRYLLLAFFFVGSFIAVMGILEYWFPEMNKLFPAFISNTKPSMSQEGFARAQFSFWGGPQATFICVLALPGAIALAKWWPRWLPRTAIIFGVLSQVIAIYIGGYRSIWLVLFIQVLAACLLGLKKHGVGVAILCFVIGIAGYQLVPLLPKTSERAFSGIAALHGQPIDSSAASRQNRAMSAFSEAIAAPFGSGWSTAGWVHSDFLQVAANLGIVAGILFLGGYFYTLLRLGRRVVPNLRAGGHGDLGFSLLLSFIAAGGILALEGASVLPQLILPVWFVWATAEVWLRQTAEVTVLSPVIRNGYSNRFAPMGISPGFRTGA